MALLPIASASKGPNKRLTMYDVSVIFFASRQEGNHSSDMTEILCGIHAVIECLKAGRRNIHEVWVTEERLAQVSPLVRGEAPALHEVTAREIDRVAGSNAHHQGIAARADPFSYAPLADIVQRAVADPKGAFIILLDQIQDPQNLGAIIRTANGVGAHGVVITKDNAAAITPTVCQAAAGATEYLRIAQVTNLAETINQLKSHNIWVVGTEGGGSQTIYEYRFDGAHAIAFGAEGRGLRRLIRERCDILLAIPMQSRINSFNVSAAAAILMGEVMRQRIEGKTTKTP